MITSLSLENIQVINNTLNTCKSCTFVLEILTIELTKQTLLKNFFKAQFNKIFFFLLVCIITFFFIFQYQGDEKLDTDIPTVVEAKLFDTTIGKAIWMFLQPFFYALRPLVTYPKKPTVLEITNTIVQLSFNFFIYFYFGGKLLNNYSSKILRTIN